MVVRRKRNIPFSRYAGHSAVGSPTMIPLARRTAGSSITEFTPTICSSSSVVKATVTGTSSRTSVAAASIMAAHAPFMSTVPRP